MNRLKILLTFFAATTVLFCSGCVDRLIKITSNPPGAAVWLNDQEIGTTPVTVPFTWYGKYSLALRKDGYDAVITARETERPIYELPVLDFFSECVVPFTFRDLHEWDYEMNKNDKVDENKLIIRAERMKIQSQSK